ncbi:MAG: AAA family ATPase [Brevundimonas sp.]|uniref:ParA family protein n=1 Tax=Brevundimonas sp. TaxID=1871086 RepID=UPI001A2B4558|nr:ParA family protein [Brevundimonas sp.]MBJ7447019.1 AAA family ATPase [Brevundimonas sp.]
MKIVTIFNNKGGVGKTTLSFHLAHALGEMGKKVLMIDLDPQCNLTIYSLSMEDVHKVWAPEDAFIDDFQSARNSISTQEFDRLVDDLRSVHFILKPTEDGTAELDQLPQPIELGKGVDLIPGRLTLHLYEAKVGERWSGVYQGDPLSIRTATRIRSVAREYADRYGYDYVLFDTSPSLGALNKSLLSLADGFIIPCSPDLFSLYGIRNIGSALKTWRSQFETIFHFLSDSKRSEFPSRFVEFLGYTIYNAKKYSGSGNSLNIAQAHFHYAERIPETIETYIAESSRTKVGMPTLRKAIGGMSVIHTHNTLPSMAQKYTEPMWKLPSLIVEPEDRNTIMGNRKIYEDTKAAYIEFAEDFVRRAEALDD